MRLWCLGDSLTEGSIGGSVSSPGGGYRQPLRTALLAAAVDVTFVGTIAGADTPSTAHDGHGGYSIGMIRADRAPWQATALPDVTVLLAGTNNLVTVATAPEHREGAAYDLLRLIREVYRDGNPSIVVVALPPVDLSIRAYRADVPGLITRFNQLAETLVDDLIGQGLPVAWVDPGLTTADLNDGVHPDADGYVLIANAVLPAVLALLDDGSS